MTETKARITITAKDRTRAAFKATEDGLENVAAAGRKTATVLTGIAGVGVGSLGAVVTMTGRATKENLAYAQSLDTPIQELTAWGFAANTVSLSQEKLNDILKDTSEKIADAYANNGGEAVEVLERLNLQSAELVKLSPDQQLLRIAEQLDNVGTQAERVQLLESLASDATLLLPLLENDAARFQELRDEAIATGAAISDIDAFQIQAANDALVKTQGVITGIGNTITVGLSPYITAVADQFSQAAISSNGFRDEIMAALQGVVEGIGVLRDALFYLDTAWTTVKLGGVAAFDAIIQSIQWVDGAVVDLLNLINGTNVPPNPELVHWANASQMAVDDVAASLEALLEQERPSIGLLKALEDIEVKSRETAEETAKNVQAAMAMPAANDSFVNVELQKQQELLNNKLANVQQYLMSAEEKEVFAYENRQAIVQANFENELITEQQRNQLLEQLRTKHEKTLSDIELRGLTARDRFAVMFRRRDLKGSLAAAAEMTQGVATQNKTLFKLNKYLALANAAVSLPDAVLQSFRNGGGYPWGLLPASLMAATGAAQIAAINSAQFGGAAASTAGLGGGSSTVNTIPIGGATVSPVNLQQEAANNGPSGGTTTINLVGDDNTKFTTSQVEQMFEHLQEGIDRGDKIIITRNSRQYQELIA